MSRKHMYQERTLLKFNRYYVHGVRNEWDFEKAADEAFWKTRGEILADLGADGTFETNAERENVWSDCLEVLMLFRIAIKSIPPDREKLEELRSDRKKQEHSLEELVGGDDESTSASIVTAAVVNGLKSMTGDKEGESGAKP